jgi:hypothetical protein
MFLFTTTRQPSVSQSATLNDGTQQVHSNDQNVVNHLSILRRGNTVLLTVNFLDATKFTTLT